METTYTVLLNDFEYQNLSVEESNFVSDLIYFGNSIQSDIHRIDPHFLQSDHLHLLPIEYTTPGYVDQPGIVMLRKRYIIQSMADILLDYLNQRFQLSRAPRPGRPLGTRHPSARALIRAQTPRYTRPRPQTRPGPQ